MTRNVASVMSRMYERGMTSLNLSSFSFLNPTAEMREMRHEAVQEQDLDAFVWEEQGMPRCRDRGITGRVQHALLDRLVGPSAQKTGGGWRHGVSSSMGMVTYDGNRLGVDLVLMLLFVMLELVQFDEHDSLLQEEAPAGRLTHAEVGDYFKAVGKESSLGWQEPQSSHGKMVEARMTWLGASNRDVMAAIMKKAPGELTRVQ
ncbi:hypothetical protein EDB83DRAFT_2313738 [Lactarius deliciosus]|nr:hypothetical protein EDB83DRAFT_2313738 [Lactarius deliciosus]